MQKNFLAEILTWNSIKFEASIFAAAIADVAAPTNELKTQEYKPDFY